MARCVSAVLERSGNHGRGKEEVNYEEIVYGEVLTRRQIFVTSVEVALTVGSVRRHCRLKGVCLAILSIVSNRHRPVLDIPKW